MKVASTLLILIMIINNIYIFKTYSFYCIELGPLDVNLTQHTYIDTVAINHLPSFLITRK